MAINKRQIIIDTDPGQDDAVAILFALGAANYLNVLGLTTVAGNVSLDKTTRNACAIRDWAGYSNLSVHPGCASPLVKPLITAESVHGETGLDGVVFPSEVTPASSESAIAFMYRCLMMEPKQTVTLVAIGPLSNIATLLLTHPEILPRIQEIVVMGGGIAIPGNITKNAEFNFYVDPDAARIVLSAGAKLTVLPLDMTHQVLTSKETIYRIGQLRNKAGAIVEAILNSHERHALYDMGLSGAPLHDPCTIGYLLAPELFRGAIQRIDVLCHDEQRGGVVLYPKGEAGYPVNWINQVDASELLDLFIDMLSHLP